MVKIYRTPFADQGDKQSIPVATDPQGYVADETGFTPRYEQPDTDPNYLPIERGEMNGILNEITGGLGEVQQYGYAHWQAGQYPQGARVLEGGVVYRAKVATAAQPPHADWEHTEHASGDTVSKAYSVRLTAIKKTAWNTAAVRAGTTVRVGDVVIAFESDTPCLLRAPEQYVGGVDYAVIALDDGTAYSTRDSYATPAVVPGNGSRIGGYHFGRTPEAEGTSGKKTPSNMTALRGIRELSIWDLRICPMNAGAQDNRGMTRDAGGGLWVDIYLVDSQYAVRGFSSPLNLAENGDSQIAGGGAQENGRQYPVIPTAYGGNGSATYGATKWWHVNEIAAASGKRLPSYAEMTAVAYGVVENATMQSLSKTYNTGAQAYVKELMSSCGVEHVVGSQYQWCSDLMSPYQFVKWEWRDKSVETDGRGNLYMTADNNPTALRFGGDATDDPMNVGSRTVNSSNYLWASFWYYGLRCVCDCLYL